jgi:hypothetical protein
VNAKQVAKEVAARLGRPFSMYHHQRAWARYGVRASGFDPTTCDTRYCVPDHRHQDYGYTADWIDLLARKLSDDDEYEALTARSTTTPLPLPARTSSAKG